MSVHAPASRKKLATATASAEPSSGSVEEPSSSSRTSECGPASRERRSRLVMCAEKVESAASMDCASPMSARNAVNTGKLAAVAGTGRPACAIMASRATVLSVTVLPPVLGPLMMSWRCSPVSSRVSGTTRDIGADAARAQALLEQRMAGVVEAEQIGRDGWAERSRSRGRSGHGRAGCRPARERGRPSTSERSMGADLAGEGDEDAMNLGLLFFEEADQFVVLLDGFEGLDVDGLA